MADTEQSLGPRDRVLIKLNLGNNYSFSLQKRCIGRDCIFSPLSGLCSHSKEERGCINASADLRKQAVIFFYLNHSSYSPGVNELLPEGSRPPSRIVFSAAWPNVFLLLKHLQGFSEWNFLKIIVKCEPPIQQYLQNCLLSSSQALKEALSASKEILDW